MRRLAIPLIPWGLTAWLAGCSTVAVTAPAPAPTAPAAPVESASTRPLPSPKPANLDPVARFGAIRSIRLVEGESQVIYDRFDDPATKHPGTATSYYLVMGETEYAVHYDHAAKLLALKPGDTVNLHPSGYGVCFIRGEVRDCRQLMLVYPGKRRANPITARF